MAPSGCVVADFAWVDAKQDEGRREFYLARASAGLSLVR